MFWKTFEVLCTQEGLSPNAVAKELKISSGTVTGWKQGNKPSATNLKKIADRFGIPVEELLGEETSNKTSNGTIFTIQGGSAMMMLKLRIIPVYESVSAGFGTLARSEIVSYVPCVIDSEAEAAETLGIRVEGDSMYPKIEDGDIVVVHKQTSVDSGTLAVVMVDGTDGYVKRVEYGSDWINLISLNPMYPPIRFKGADVLRVQVVGRVTRIIKDV